MDIERVIELLRESKRKAKCPKGFKYSKKLRSCVPIRKKGKLPGKVLRQKYSLEYGNDEIQIHSNSITSRDRILIIDDLIATGGTAVASAKLISKCKVKNIEFYFIIDLKNVGGSQKLGKKFKLSSILEAEG